MKIAVIIGVVHMMLGLVIRFLNGIKQKNYVDIYGLFDTLQMVARL